MTPETGLYKVVNEFYTNDPSRRKHHVGDLVLLIEFDRDDTGLLGAVAVYSDTQPVYRVAFLAHDGIVCRLALSHKTFSYFLQNLQKTQ